MKYGGRDLGELFDKARRAAKGEEAPEEVRERGGDFYIVPIVIAGKEKELFYSPFHMAKITAFIKITEDDSHEKVHIQVSENHQKIFPYKCWKCERTYSEEEYRKDHFCRKCETWLRRA